MQMWKEEGLKLQGGRARGKERYIEIIGQEEEFRRRGGSAIGQGGRAKGARRKD